MKKNKILLYALIPALFTIMSCDFGVVEDEDPNTLATITIAGQVVNDESGDGLAEASVKITSPDTVVATTTNSAGEFSVKLSLADDSQLTIVTSKVGFDPDTSSYYANIDETQLRPMIKLIPSGGSVIIGGGRAASVYLFSQSDLSVGVKESGANESVSFVFQVLDSSGVAIGSSRSVIVNFLLQSDLSGGEYLFPASKETNALGRASVTLNSGSTAGVVQVIAEIRASYGVIRSKPILLSIHGGFPDAGHFDVAAEKLNYPALGIIGFEIDFTAFVGDKYSNPVRPGTSVYFNATSGIIEGSNLTDDLGRSVVTLLTQPWPNHPVYGPGFFTVTATTINENQQEIDATTVRLQSGLPVLSSNPTTFDLQNGGSQIINYVVSDGNGNPLSSGQTIAVTVTEGDVKVIGDTEITMLDTQSKAYTNYSFTVYDAKPDTTRPHQAILEISTTGPNGDKKMNIIGTAR